MFKELGQMASLMKNLPKIQEEMAKFQESLGKITADGNAGAGYVTVTVNGNMQLIACTISEDAWKMNDREMLEDLVIAAVNQALSKVREQVALESGKLAGNLGLPGGLNLPGLG